MQNNKVKRVCYSFALSGPAKSRNKHTLKLKRLFIVMCQLQTFIAGTNTSSRWKLCQCDAPTVQSSWPRYAKCANIFFARIHNHWHLWHIRSLYIWLMLRNKYTLISLQLSQGWLCESNIFLLLDHQYHQIEYAHLISCNSAKVFDPQTREKVQYTYFKIMVNMYFWFFSQIKYWWLMITNVGN